MGALRVFVREHDELLVSLAGAVAFVAVVFGGAWLISESVEDGPGSPAVPAPSGERAFSCPEDDRACHEWGDIRESEVKSPTVAQLMAGHGCWTIRDGAPGNVDGIPGGAVVRVDGGDPLYTENAGLIAYALDAALDGTQNGVEGLAFCRGGQ